ncbi:MAG TPA: cupin domain-containing protein [Solirubrobacteraceae bacterium]|nr:cupin domain-containing protein [Solirubrobacteraceae bacterium]
MKISHGHETGEATSPMSETFTGTALRDPVLTGDDVLTVNSVTFPPGARTHWHTHETGQVLVVTSGHGRAGTREGARETLQPGDVVWFSAGEEHWHGAGPDTVMTHLAISLGATDWADPVSDADYAGS